MECLPSSLHVAYPHLAHLPQPKQLLLYWRSSGPAAVVRTLQSGAMHQLRPLGLQCEARIRRFPRAIPGTVSSRNRRHKSVHQKISRATTSKLHRRALPKGRGSGDVSSQKPQPDVYSWKQRLPGCGQFAHMQRGVSRRSQQDIRSLQPLSPIVPVTLMLQGQWMGSVQVAQDRHKDIQSFQVCGS